MYNENITHISVAIASSTIEINGNHDNVWLCIYLMLTICILIVGEPLVSSLLVGNPNKYVYTNGKRRSTNMSIKQNEWFDHILTILHVCHIPSNLPVTTTQKWDLQTGGEYFTGWFQNHWVLTKGDRIWHGAYREVAIRARFAVRYTANLCVQYLDI
jgi:hypothetical protein